MFDIAKYVIAALAVICIALAITVGVQTARVAGIKSDLNAAILERDSLQSLSVSQSERLANINILLGEAEKACAKRLETRGAVEAIFYKNKIPPPAIEQKRSEHRQTTLCRSEHCSGKVELGGSAMQTHVLETGGGFHPNKTMEKLNESVIPFDKSSASIRLINDSLRVFGSEGSF